jgi:hypothetical protein
MSWDSGRGDGNGRVCGRLLDDLIERDYASTAVLFVSGWQQGIKKGGPPSVRQPDAHSACQVHKQRMWKVICRIPEEGVSMKYHAALNMRIMPARQELEKVHRWLMGVSEAAARSLEEGMEELLTVHRLKLRMSCERLWIIPM